MQVSEGTIKQLVYALKENSKLLKWHKDETEKKEAPDWVKVGELKNRTNWKNHRQFADARKRKLVETRYEKINGVDTGTYEYNIKSINKDYLVNNQINKADSALIETISKRMFSELKELFKSFV